MAGQQCSVKIRSALFKFGIGLVQLVGRGPMSNNCNDQLQFHPFISGGLIRTGGSEDVTFQWQQ